MMSKTKLPDRPPGELIRKSQTPNILTNYLQLPLSRLQSGPLKKIMGGKEISKRMASTFLMF